MSVPATKPVLIVGAGPTGLVLALTLAKNGIPVRIIEKDAQHHVGQRGAGLQPRSLELFHFLGVLPDIVAGGMSGPLRRCIYQMPEGRVPLKIFDFSPQEEPTPSVPYRMSILIGQAHNEEILRAHLAKYGVQVELNTELVSFEQDEGGVTAHIVKRDGEKEVPEAVAASYLVGADGARSVVRKQLGFTFLGETRTEDRILVTDLEIKNLSNEYLHSWGEHGSSALFARPTEYERVFACAIFGRDVDFDPFLKDHEALFRCIRQISNRPELEFGDVKWISEWRPNIRMANKFDEGRVFIMGDAAHVHSPAGGQGLNSSVQDAYNLAWKLSLVYKGLADPSLLNSYTEERLPVIADMLGRTTLILDQTIKVKADGSNWDSSVRTKIMHQLGVNCRWSSIVVDEQPEAKDVSHEGAYLPEDTTRLYAGDRAPQSPGLVNVGDASTKTTSLFDNFGPTYHTALIFVADAEQAKPILESLKGYPEGTVKTVAILPKGAEKPAVAPGADLTVVDEDGHAYAFYAPANKGFPLVVVRPDGVVGAVVKDAEGIRRYFDAIFARN